MRGREGGREGERVGGREKERVGGREGGGREGHFIFPYRDVITVVEASMEH